MNKKIVKTQTEVIDQLVRIFKDICRVAEALYKKEFNPKNCLEVRGTPEAIINIVS